MGRSGEVKLVGEVGEGDMGELKGDIFNFLHFFIMP